MDYTTICFVIMPFGKKELIDENGQRRTVDFDSIYQDIFHPAICDARLPEPEQGALEPRRTDQDFFSGDISQEMFDYLEYSRIALTDITGLNPNVFYELGVRHRARQSGTTIFRQIATRIPFDINQIKAFAYDYEPELQARESTALITRILIESLAQNRIDSPVQRALAVQQAERPQIQVDLVAAENALRVGDRPRAISAYRRALAGDPRNNLLQMRLGLLLKDDGRWPDALEHFDRAIAAAPTYGEAYREKGIAENKLSQKAGQPAGMPNGVEALTRAVELNPDDYDAHASLAGALKRDGRLADALAEYERATEVSRGHSYPLLNALKLKAQLEGKLDLDARRRFLLKRAERSLRAQVASDPPHDPPWSFFDLSEIRLYDGDKNGFLSYASKGAEYATHAWQLNTFRESLERLPAAGIDLPGLGEAIALLREQASYLQ